MIPLLTSSLPNPCRLAEEAISGLNNQLDDTLRSIFWTDKSHSEIDSVIVGKRSSLRREALLAVINGVFGDFLEERGHPLAIPTRFTCKGHPVAACRQQTIAPIERPKRKVLVLVHGLCMNDLQWIRPAAKLGNANINLNQVINPTIDGCVAHHITDNDFYSCLANDLGYTSVALHYNSGRHISINGREFSQLMDLLVRQWPVPVDELVIVANSMGGLVTRSACYYAEQDSRYWLQALRKIVFLGTPHHGAPLERGGNWVDAALSASPFTRPLANLCKIRSAGITDLRYGNLLDEDWQGRDRFERRDDQRLAVPLPEGVNCYAVAATHWKNQDSIGGRLIGDGLVPVDSALGRHPQAHLNLSFPEPHQQIVYGTTHLRLLDQPDIKAQVRHWLK